MNLIKKQAHLKKRILESKVIDLFFVKKIMSEFNFSYYRDFYFLILEILKNIDDVSIDNISGKKKKLINKLNRTLSLLNNVVEKFDEFKLYNLLLDIVNLREFIDIDNLQISNDFNKKKIFLLFDFFIENEYDDEKISEMFVKYRFLFFEKKYNGITILEYLVYELLKFAKCNDVKVNYILYLIEKYVDFYEYKINDNELKHINIFFEGNFSVNNDLSFVGELYKKIFDNYINKNSKNEEKIEKIKKIKYPKFINDFNFRNLDLVDYTNLDFFTIDPAGTVVFDDAFCLIKRDDGSFIFKCAIADVASYVNLESETEKFARNLSSTIYHFNGNIDLFCPDISRNICTLNCLDRKSAFIYSLEFDSDFNFVFDSFRVDRGIIKVKHNYSYEDITSILKLNYGVEFETIRNLMNISFNIIGSNYFNSDYHKKKKLSNRKDVLYKNDYHDLGSIGNRIVAAYKILINSLIPNYYSNLGIPFPYRVNKKILLESDVFSEDYIYISAYSNIPSIHEGLGLKEYCHGSTPIRRYVSYLIQFYEWYFRINKDFNNDLLKPIVDDLNNLIRDINKAEVRNKNAVMDNDFIGLINNGFNNYKT